MYGFQLSTVPSQFFLLLFFSSGQQHGHMGNFEKVRGPLDISAENVLKNNFFFFFKKRNELKQKKVQRNGGGFLHVKYKELSSGFGLIHETLAMKIGFFFFCVLLSVTEQKIHIRYH
jgi:hypothetical protein